MNLARIIRLVSLNYRDFSVTKPPGALAAPGGPVRNPLSSVLEAGIYPSIQQAMVATVPTAPSAKEVLQPSNAAACLSTSALQERTWVNRSPMVGP